MIANALYVCNYTVESLIAKYGEETEEVLQGRQKRASKNQILYDVLPEEFTREKLKQKMSELTIRTKSRDVIYRWSRSGLVVVLPDGHIRKQAS